MKSKFIVIAIAMLMVACTSESEDEIVPIKNQVENNLIGKTWKITTYIDSGKDEKSHFTGYNFKFDSNNVLTATNGINTYVGSWSITSSNSNDDSTDSLDFNISFAAPENFQDLSDDWDIITQTSSKIELIDVSGGNGDTDYLTFEKN